MEKNLSTVNQKNLDGGQPKFSVFMNSDGVKKMIANAVGKNAQSFTASVISAVTTNPALQGCDQRTILSAALLGESLKLSPSPQLGQYYFVPFKDKNRGLVAQFILGYKGYIQLAIRSGQYKKLNVLALKKGEVKRYDPLTEDIDVDLIEDENEREKAETVGYYAMFEYVNGFRKAIYWSYEKMISHADRYSQAFSKNGCTVKGKKKVSYADYLAGKYIETDAWLYSSFWYKDFDGMALKTMLRQLISKWGALSVDLEKAIVYDDKIVEEANDGVILADDPNDLSGEKATELPLNEETGDIISDKQEAEPAQEEAIQPLGTAMSEDFSSDDFFR